MRNPPTNLHFAPQCSGLLHGIPFVGVSVVKFASHGHAFKPPREIQNSQFTPCFPSAVIFSLPFDTISPLHPAAPHRHLPGESECESG